MPQQIPGILGGLLYLLRLEYSRHRRLREFIKYICAMTFMIWLHYVSLVEAFSFLWSSCVEFGILILGYPIDS